MKITSSRFQLEDVDSRSILHFPEGIPGFEQDKEFVLFKEDVVRPHILFLQSKSNPDVTLTVADPSEFGLNYSIALTKREVEVLGENSDQEGIILVVLSGHKESLDNIQRRQIIPHVTSPIIVNLNNKKGIQKILDKMDYEVNISVRQKDDQNS